MMNDPVQFQMLDLVTNRAWSDQSLKYISQYSDAESTYWCLIWVVNSYKNPWKQQDSESALDTWSMIYYIYAMYEIKQLQYTLVIHCPWSCSRLRAKHCLNKRGRITFNYSNRFCSDIFGGIPLVPCQGLYEQGNKGAVASVAIEEYPVHPCQDSHKK